MKRLLSLGLLILNVCFGFAQSKEDNPKLMVGIVVDQMRQEYLSRFSDHFGEGGFKRLINDGYEFKNAHFNYIPTSTAPGHASVYSGTTPRTHGVIGNDWYDKANKWKVYCVEDRDVTNVGGSEAYAARSPKNLLSTTITDELRQFYGNRTKIISISIKDRGAILPGGHNPDGAFWYDSMTGEFMTSSYYRDELPKWVKTFNELKLPEKYTNQVWDTFFPIEKYIESQQDDRPYERAMLKKIDPVFPYDLKEIGKERGANGLLPSTPFGNTIIADLAIEALKNENLGVDLVTDFLAISFSSTDYIGHDFGPYSKEVQDTYVRLDRELARLFEALDKNVGKGKWSAFLTADHAVAAIPKGQSENKQHGGYYKGSSIQPKVKSTVEEYFKTQDLIEIIHGNQVYFDREVLSVSDLDFKEVKNYTIDLLIKQEGIAAAYDVKEVHTYQGKNRDAMIVSRGVNLERNGDVIFILNSGWLPEGYSNGGTGHGSPYVYDTHVPMVFYGAGFKKGASVEYQPITGIAPTISMLLNISLPDGCSGAPLSKVLKTE